MACLVIYALSNINYVGNHQSLPLIIITTVRHDMSLTQMNFFSFTNIKEKKIIKIKLDNKSKILFEHNMKCKQFERGMVIMENLTHSENPK